MPQRRVHHFGVELQAVQPPRLIGHGGDGRVGAEWARARKPGGSARCRSPWLIHTSSGEPSPANSGESRDQHGDLGRAVLARLGRGHLAAQVMAEQLHAVADAQDRHAARQQTGRVRVGRAGVIDAVGAAREDDALRAAARPTSSAGRIPGQHLAIDVALAHAARDELAILRAIVHDDDRLMLPPDLCHIGVPPLPSDWRIAPLRIIVAA